MTVTARYISLGAGTQSTAVFLMWLEGDIDADFAVFADTGWEPAEVYGHLWRLAELGYAAGRPIYVVSDGNIRDRHLGGQSLVSMPLFVGDSEAAPVGKLFRSPVYLHRSGRPLDTPGLLDNEEDRGQGTLFGCDSGFCGT